MDTPQCLRHGCATVLHLVHIVSISMHFNGVIVCCMLRTLEQYVTIRTYDGTGTYDKYA